MRRCDEKQPKFDCVWAPVSVTHEPPEHLPRQARDNQQNPKQICGFAASGVPVERRLALVLPCVWGGRKFTFYRRWLEWPLERCGDTSCVSKYRFRL